MYLYLYCITVYVVYTHGILCIRWDACPDSTSFAEDGPLFPEWSFHQFQKAPKAPDFNLSEDLRYFSKWRWDMKQHWNPVWFRQDFMFALDTHFIALIRYVFLDSFLPFGGVQFKSWCTVTEQREYFVRKWRRSKRCGNVSAASHFALHWDLLALLGGSLSWIYAAWQTCSVQWTDECDSWNSRSTRWPQKWKMKPERTGAHLQVESGKREKWHIS